MVIRAGFVLCFVFPIFSDASQFDCFAGAVSMAEQIGGSWQIDETFTHQNLSLTCQELSQESLYAHMTDKWIDKTQSNGFQDLLQEQTPSFRTLYKSEISKLLRIDTFEKRIKATYDFIVIAFGDLTFQNRQGSKAIFSDFKAIGLRGRNVERAVLLAMTLERVRRTKNEFEVHVVADQLKGENPNILGIWVRIKMLRIARNHIIFDLDPSVSGSIFTPLYPRKNRLPDSLRSKALDECRNVRACLMRLELKMAHQ